jgi:molecular chaperone GrpE
MEKDQNTETENKINKEDNQIKTSDDIQQKPDKELSSEEKVKELEDKLTRTFAEMENQRRRYEKEKDEAFDYGGFSFARETLNLVDNLERAKQSLKNDESLSNTKNLDKTLEHLEILNKDILSIFKKNNIEPIASINRKLDPNYHQAMIEIEDNEKEPGTIIQEIQKGFTMKDRLLRPALVGVSKKEEKKQNKNEEVKKDEKNKEKNNKND